jgi:hypothetical protein
MWTQSEVDYLMNHFANTRTCVIQKNLARSYSSVAGKAALLGLVKSAEFKASHASGRMLKGDMRGKETQFKKGTVPANKGKKMSARQYAIASATMFKPGQDPKNTLHDGAITVRTDKRGVKHQWIRIAKAKWVPLHMHNYQQSFGEIPKGMVVVFKDRNTLNAHPSNLALLSMADNMRRNTIHQYPEDIKKAIRLVGKLKRTINEKQN